MMYKTNRVMPSGQGGQGYATMRFVPRSGNFERPTLDDGDLPLKDPYIILLSPSEDT